MTSREHMPVIGIVLLVFAVASFGVAAQTDPAAALHTLILSPQWSSVFHLFAFFLIFLGIIVRPLQEKFGNAGVAVAAGFAILLSASLALTGRLNLLELEPVAAIGIFVLFGAVIAAAFHRLYEAGWPTTVALGFVCGYGALRIAAPSLQPVLQEFFLVYELWYVVAVVWLIYRFVSLMIPHGTASWASHVLRTLSARPAPVRRHVRESLKAQEALSAVAEQEFEEHAAILAELDETAKSLKAAGAEHPEYRAAIRNRMAGLEAQRRKTEEELERFKTLVRRVEELDATEYANLTQAYDELPDKTRKEARKELRGLRAKLTTDKVQRRLADAIQANNTAFKAAIQQATKELNEANAKGCLQALKDAQAAEREAIRLAAQIKRFADQFKTAAAKIIAHASTREPAGITR